VQMRAELKRLHQNLQATIIYVTHDQVEAMTMADKIVIMKDGIIQQIGDPYSVYFEPRNKFVAGFIGTPAMNFISAKLVSENGSVWVVKEDMKLLVPEDKVDKVKGLVGKDITFGIRPEDIYDKMYAVAPKDEYTVKGSVDVVEPLGSETLIHANIHGDDIVAKVDPKSRAAAGDKMDLVFDMSMMHLFDPETEENVLAGTHQDATPENL